jgi:beta-glucosidase
MARRLRRATHERYSDRVKYWLTINEPNIFWSLSAEAATFPPAEKLPPDKLVQGSVNILQGHGRSVKAIRAAAKQPVKVALSIAGMINMPATESPADIAAARDSSFTLNPIQRQAGKSPRPAARHPAHTLRWAITPDILYWGPRFLYERYKHPILITENGMSWNDTVSPDGHVHDPVRAQFIHDYLTAYRRAIHDGVEAHGYF